MSAHESVAALHEASIRKQAVAWYAQLCSGEATDADRAAWQRWHEAHPDHQRAWRTFASLQSTLGRVPGGVAASTLRAARRSRRGMLRTVAGLAGAGAAAGLAWQWTEGAGGLRASLAEHRTGTGEQRPVVLADGSSLLLNTRSAVDVSFDDAHRRVLLREGDILVQTAPAAPGGRRDTRPFTVQTPQGRILALGTRFTVRSEGERTVVGVLAHAVEVRALQGTGPAVRVDAGQQTAFTRTQVEAPQAAQPAVVDWPEGSLIVDGWRLDDVVRELARYRPGRLACDPAVADIRVSGVFPLADTDKALAVLTRAFPVRVVGMTRYWLTLAPA